MRLTRRELECMQWVRRGKTAFEIGIILGISERTARFHTTRAQAKLNTVTLPQAVAQCYELGIFTVGDDDEIRVPTRDDNEPRVLGADLRAGKVD